MPEHSLPDDELLSSYLDGELTAEEIARLDARLATDSDLAERLESLRAAESLASTRVAPLLSADADRMIHAALAASTTAGNVTDLAAASTRRRNVWPARLATVAAGAVVLVLGVSALQAIDTGDDADTASSGDSSEQSTFDTALPDDGDADTAGAMAAEAALDENFGGGDDSADFAEGASAEDDMTDDATSNDDVSDFDAEAFFADNSTAFQLFDTDPQFDPIADDLGEFTDMAQLSTRLSQTWTQFLTETEQEPPTTSTTQTFDELERRDRALLRLESAGLTECDGVALIVDYFEGDTVLAADYATATVDGDPETVGLFQLSDGEAVLLVIDQQSCDLKPSLLAP